MALAKTWVTPSGITVEDAYHRIGSVRVSNKDRLFFELSSFKGKDEPVPFMVENYACEYDFKENNVFECGYLHLKTLDKFTGSADC